MNPKVPGGRHQRSDEISNPYIGEAATSMEGSGPHPLDQASQAYRSGPRRMAGSDVSEDMAQGQVVIVTARWVLISAALAFTFWNAESIDRLRIAIPLLLLFAIWNFYLHAQLLKRRPAIDAVVYAASVTDIAVISLINYVQGGFAAESYIFYFPAFLALSVAFSTGGTVLFVGAGIVAYVLTCLPTLRQGSDDVQTILLRVVTLAAVAACGNLYWRIEGSRRREAMQAREELMGQIRAAQSMTSPQV